MLTLIEGGFYSGVHEEIKARIAKNTNAHKKCLLIVPEQQTVTAELEMAAELPSFAPLSFEVTNFTRLANSAFRALGGIHLEYATGEKKSLIMWQSLTELSPFLSMTKGRREITAGMVERAMAASKEAHALGMDAELLAEYSRTEGISKRLSEKLSDLSKITALYKKKLAEKYSDSEDDIGLLIKKLEENPSFLSDTEIFIEGFTSFTAPQYSLIGVLVSRCELTVALNVPKADGAAFEYSEVQRTHSRIASLADKADKKKKLLRLDGAVNVKSELLQTVAPALWKSNYQIDNYSLQNDGDLRIFEAKTPFDECELVASDIRRRVMEGAAYRDFAVIAADASKYDGILDTALDKADVPHFSSYKTSLLDYEAVKLIFSALAATRGFAREDVLAYASCGLSGIGYDERDELAMYTERWKISGERFTDGLIWNMHPDGFDGKKTDASDEALLRIDATRVKLTEPLMALRDAISQKTSVREHAMALFTFFERIHLEENLSRRRDKLFSLGLSVRAEENSALFGVICSALDTLVEVLGDTVTDAETFAAQLKTVFSATELGRIPSSLDEVIIGSADMLRLSDKKHVYMIGVNYGEFPDASRGSSYFSGKDREALVSLGIDADPAETDGARALYSFSRAFSYASESVTLLYSRSDASFGALIPSFVIGNIIKLTGERVKPVKISELSALDTLYSPVIASETLSCFPKGDALAARAALTECGASTAPRAASIDNGSLVLSSPSGDNTLYLTQSRIDTFVSCPLQYFCKFTLSLDEGERAEFGSSGIGSYVHAILENFFSEVKTKDLNVKELTQEAREDMMLSAAKKYLSGIENELGMNSARMKTALSRILRAARPVVDGLCEEFAVSGFKPAFFELKISKNGKEGPTPVEIKGEGGEKIYIYGTIDRVDTMEKDGNLYVRVVDYKTGSKDFHPTDMKEGRNLQMFLYLKSLLECENPSFKKALGVPTGGEVIPAGLIYVKTDIKDQRVNTPSDGDAEEAVKAAQKRKGMILDDSDIYLAMGKEYIPIKLTKSGVDKRSEPYLYTRERWEEISREIEDVVGKIGHRISRGDIRSATGKDKKKKSPCEWCSYKAFCRNIKL